MTLNTQRDLLYFDIQKKSRELTKSEDFLVWNTLENLEKAAATMHKDFKNLWKWAKGKHPYNDPANSQSGLMLKLDLTNILFILVNGLNEELAALKAGLVANDKYMIKGFDN